jgi:antirestriction protein ArdC
MNTDTVKQLCDEALGRLATALEQGQSDALKTYLATMSRFHKYSWGNVLLIATQKPNASHVAGFQTWRKLNRFVRKGETGIAIFAPIVVKKRNEGEESEDEQTRLFGFRTAYVFDESQTDGEPLPPFATVKGDPMQFTATLETLIGERGIALEYTDRIAPAKGMSSGGRIEVLPGLPAAERFSVLAHELAHEMIHKGERRKNTSQTVRETEAEAVAFVVSHSIGLDTNTAASDYISLYQGDQATLAESLEVIQKTAAEILRAIKPAHDPLR